MGITLFAPLARIAKTITINGNLDIQGGALIWYENGGLAQNFVIYGDVKVDTRSAIYVCSGATNQRMSIGGNLINNTDGLTHGLSTRSKVDFTSVPVTFFGPNSASVSNTTGNPLTVFSNVTINKGSSPATTLTLDISGTLNTPGNNWLTLQNGTLIYNRSNPSSDFTISTNTPFSIPATAGLTINLPSNTGNRNVLIGNINNNSADLLLSGKLTLINGNVYVGRTSGTDNNNNDIEYSSSGYSAIDVQGGNLTVNGQIRRNPLNAGGILQYSQSGGIVTINGQASNATNAKLEVLNPGSGFTMSNGTLTIVRGNGSTTTASTPFGDLYLRPETSSVTGGTIIFNQAAGTEQNFYLDATIPLNNLTIADAGQPSTVHLLVSPLVINGNTIINSNSVLDSKNINITFNGNLTNTPGVTGYLAGTNLTTFSATNIPPLNGVQTITGTTDFYDLTVSPAVSLALSNPSTISHNLVLNTGNFILGANPVSLKGDFTNNATYLDNNLVGNGILLNGTTLQKISGAGAYARLTLNNAAGAQVLNDIGLQEDLTMTQGILDIKKNLVTLGASAFIQGAPFSDIKMITSDGVFSNVGLRKYFNPIAATTTFLYPLGTSGKYTPALLRIDNSNTLGYVRVNNINNGHPSVYDPANALSYYWEVQSSGITGFTGNLELNYYQSDVIGDESNYMAGRIIVPPGTTWNLTNTVDKVNNKISNDYAGSNNLGGEYTAGITSAFFSDVPEYTSNADGNWTNQAIWDQTSGDTYPCPVGGPNGFIVNVNHVITINTNSRSAYRTIINNELRILAPSYGHNLGTVTGSGKLYLESGSFPAGVFTAFLACSNNSTVEYGGTGTYTIIADLYDQLSKIVFSGTGSRVLPNKVLTICNQFKINGPTLPSTLSVDNSVSNQKLIIQGTIEKYGTGSTFISGSGAGATVSFAGSGPQAVGGALGDFTGASAFNNLEINNNAGLRINDAGAVEIKGNLLLLTGLINTGGGRTLTITNSAINCVIPAGGSASSFVDGPLIKSISQFDNFLFPVGKSGTPNVLGNNIRLSSTQTGPLLWTAEYMTPNTKNSSAFITSPLLGVSSQEFYTVSTTAGSQAILNLNWTPSSDVNPLITGGLSNIRLSNYNTGTSKWVEIPTSSVGNNTNGTATSTSLITSTGSDDYTLGSITDLKPRAKLNPTGPVCGATGIPVSFTAPYAIPLPYTLSYTIGVTAQTPIVINSIPVGGFILPTPIPGDYKLTDFSYNGGASIGVVDAGIVSVYLVPTTSAAGTDQAICGITTATLTGNTPVVGTGFWSINTGAGGTLITPTSPTSQFIGSNGTIYTLRWTISSGTCTSIDDVIINFTLPPAAPAAAANQNLCGPSTIADLVATPPAGCTVDWYDLPTGGVLLGSGTTLVSGTTYYGESKVTSGGCISASRTAVTVTINPLPSPSLNGITPVCDESTGNVYTTDAGKDNYDWVIAGGFISSGGSSTDNTASVTWTTPGAQTISVNYETAAGCAAASPIVYNVYVNALPTVTITNPAPVCSPATVNLTNGAVTAGSTGSLTFTYWTDASATVAYGTPTTASDGIYYIKGTDASGCFDVKPVVVTVNPMPAAIAGTLTVCIGSTTTLSDATAGGAWSSATPANATIDGGGVVTGVAAGTSVISYTMPSGCAVTTTVTINANPTTSSITGLTSVCAGTSGVTYSVTNTVGSTYAWTITGGAQASGTTTNSITVDWGVAGAGNVSVLETNASSCVGTAVNSAVTINANPTTSSITGLTSVCAGTSGVTYSVTNTVGSTYAWTITGGAQASGTTTNSITVDWGVAGAGNVSVLETNASSCVGTAVNSAVTINANPTTSSITGLTSVCAGTSGVTYSVTNTVGSTYAWTITGGAQASGTTTNSITVDWGVAGAGNVSVLETNASSCVGTAVNSAVTINANPTTSSITGLTSVCAGTSGVTYSVTNTVGSTYAWTITGGAQASGTTTNSITVDWGVAGAGNVSVLETNASSCVGTAVNSAVTINANPTTSSITGLTSVCAGTSGVTYSVTNTVGSTYAWTITGGAQASGTTTNSITVDWGVAGAGNVSVLETNASSCVGTAVNSAVTINANPTTSSITGLTSVCAGTSGVTYSVTNTVGSTYAWTITGGAQASGTTTNSITVDWGVAGAGNVSVLETNASSCVGTAVNSAVTINANPTTSSITGLTSVCAGTSGVTYSVTNTVGSTYAWTITGGAQASGTTTNSITVDWGVAGAGNVSVLETNASSCVGTAVNSAVTINANPTTSSITGLTSVCAGTSGVTYSVTNTVGSTYAWTITGGAQASGTTTNSITVDWGVAGAGNVSVLETNASSCVGTAVNSAVTINANPTTSSITGLTSVCAGTSGVTYSVTNTVGSTYAWTITGGAQASGTTTNSITVDWGVAGAGNVSVLETNASSCVGTAVNSAVTINANPTTSSITGLTSVCAGTSGVTYSVTNTVGSTYAWTITGGAQASGTTTNSITVDWGVAGAGNVSVLETNASSCVGTAVNSAVTINANPTTSSITGLTSVCAGTSGVTYSVTNTVGSTYAWTITGGAQASGTTTNSITVDWGVAGAGNVSVLETNASSCVGTAVNSAVTINANPTTSSITGLTSVCAGTSGVTYSVTNTVGSTYAWTITGGAQASGTTTNSITVDWGVAGAGNVSVLETNASSCVGTAVNSAVTINANPTTSSITGLTSVCAGTSGVTYSVTNTVGSTYAWTITGGAQASGTTTNSITVDWGVAGAGNVSVLKPMHQVV